MLENSFYYILNMSIMASVDISAVSGHRYRKHPDSRPGVSGQHIGNIRTAYRHIRTPSH